eukprot:4504259-Alexandrium_andersonii.AAC.1
MEWQWMCYRLKNYYRSTLLCPWCMATNNATILSWLDLRDDAAWRCTGVGTQDFLENARIR